MDWAARSVNGVQSEYLGENIPIRKMQVVEVLWALLQEGALRVAQGKLVLGAEAGVLWG